LQDLMSGFFIQAGKTMVNGQTHYDFGVASGLWLGSAVLSSVLVAAVWGLSRKPVRL
jgi:hypothetical protein